MKKPYERYSEEFKLGVLRDYYSSGMSKRSCVRKYHLSCSHLLQSWLAKYDCVKECVSLPESSQDAVMANRDKESYQEELLSLRKRVRELEKALEFSRLETLSRDIMIDKAEEVFDIPIRKKSGAK